MQRALAARRTTVGCNDVLRQFVCVDQAISVGLAGMMA
jgi:hypothetical protein